MHSLDGIIAMNRRAAEKANAETETTRHCSFVSDGSRVVLHSAKHRATVFLKGDDAAHFLKRMRQAPQLAKLRKQTEDQFRDFIIERYF